MFFPPTSYFSTLFSVIVILFVYVKINVSVSFLTLPAQKSLRKNLLFYWLVYVKSVVWTFVQAHRGQIHPPQPNLRTAKRGFLEFVETVAVS